MDTAEGFLAVLNSEHLIFRSQVAWLPQRNPLVSWDLVTQSQQDTTADATRIANTIEVTLRHPCGSKKGEYMGIKYPSTDMRRSSLAPIQMAA